MTCGLCWSGVSALLLVALEGAAGLGQMQMVEFGRGFGYKVPLSINMASVGSTILKQIVSHSQLPEPRPVESRSNLRLVSRPTGHGVGSGMLRDHVQMFGARRRSWVSRAAGFKGTELPPKESDEAGPLKEGAGWGPPMTGVGSGPLVAEPPEEGRSST